MGSMASPESPRTARIREITADSSDLLEKVTVSLQESPQVTVWTRRRASWRSCSSSSELTMTTASAGRRRFWGSREPFRARKSPPPRSAAESSGGESSSKGRPLPAEKARGPVQAVREKCRERVSVKKRSNFSLRGSPRRMSLTTRSLFSRFFDD